MQTKENTNSQPVDMKLEVVLLRVADVDRSKRFYEHLGWRLDADFTVGDNFRVIQFTPYHSPASIIFGKGVTPLKPGAAGSLVLAVNDLEAARAELITKGIGVSEIFHFNGGPFNNTTTNPRIPGRDPEDLPYYSFASFEDPDGNEWLLQEIKKRLPGREWQTKQQDDMDAVTLAGLLREAAAQHDHFEKSHAEHHWSDWYATYLLSRRNGSSLEEATIAADQYMEETLHVLPK